jgi:RNA polymerase sigma-70 factor, ECF subfamily
MAFDEKQVLTVLMDWRLRLIGVSWSVLRDNHLSEDMFQELILKALKGDAVFESESSLVSWSVITIRRASIDILRRRQKEMILLDDDVLAILDKDFMRGNAPELDQKRDALESCMKSLPEKSSQILKWRYFYGYNCDEVARRSGMSLDATYKVISRIHQKLKQCIETRMRHSVSSSFGCQGGSWMS